LVRRSGTEYELGLAGIKRTFTSKPFDSMASQLARLQSPTAVQAALDEFERIGRTAFLQKYGFGKSRDYLVRNAATGTLADSKAIVGVAFGNQYPTEGALAPADFSGGDATVVAKLQSLGFEVVRAGEDWSAEEVRATVTSYFEMLEAEAKQEAFNKSAFNLVLRQKLRGRTKSSVELKHQNISAVLASMGLPYIQGYKPRSNAQLLLRKEVQQFVLDHVDLVERMVDALEEMKTPSQQSFIAVLKDPPPIETVVRLETERRARLRRKVDYAARDEGNRELGRAGEHWVLGFEQQRMSDVGLAALFGRVDWVSDRLGDGAGYDILSNDSETQPRYIEVKTTNGAHASYGTTSAYDAPEGSPLVQWFEMQSIRQQPNPVGRSSRCLERRRARSIEARFRRRLLARQ
jgi:hypothetical protein